MCQNKKDGKTKDFEEMLLDIEEKKLQLARDQFEENNKTRDIDHKEKLLSTCKKSSDDGFPDHAVFKCYPDFKAMMGECDEDSEYKFSHTKVKHEEESIEIEEL